MKKWVRWTIGIVLGIVLLTTFLWQEENRRGKRIWEETCARLRAAGEPVELADIIPPMIPDEENVAAAPIFAEVFQDKERAQFYRMAMAISSANPLDAEGTRMSPPLWKPLAPEDMSHVVEWRDYLRACFPAQEPAAEMSPADEVLHFLQPWEVELQEVRQALERPRCRWPLHYETLAPLDGSMFSSLLGLNMMMRPRLVALAAIGDGRAHVDGVICQLRVAELFNSDCMYLIGHLMRMTTDTLALRSLQNCLPALHLEDGTLLALQRQLERIQMSDVKKVYREELVYDVHLALHVTPEQLKQWLDTKVMVVSPLRGHWPDKLGDAAEASYPIMMACRPEGWRLMDGATTAAFMHDEVLPCIDEVAGTILPSKVAHMSIVAKKNHDSAGWLSLARLESGFSTGSMLAKAARHQTLAREVVLWCAIERFRLKHGRLPEKLEELTPAFVNKLPVDPVNGLALQYVRKGEANYLLYSIGWNLKNDGGEERKATEDGDWVWASDPRLIVNPDEEKRLAEEKASKESTKSGLRRRTPTKPPEKPKTPNGVAK